jgi:hypothetical protein
MRLSGIDCAGAAAAKRHIPMQAATRRSRELVMEEVFEVEGG